MIKVIGCDVGGTFTDLISFDQASGAIRLAKVPTTPANQAEGVLHAIEQAGQSPSGVNLIIHGTPATTNAHLERKVARCGLITTKGFRDVLELGRRTRPSAYGMIAAFEPLIARELRLEVSARMDATGRVLTPLDEDGLASGGGAGGVERRQRRIERSQEFVDLRLRDRQRRAQLDVIAVLAVIHVGDTGRNQHIVVAQMRDQFPRKVLILGEWPPRRAVGDEFEPPQQAAPADIADRRVLLGEPSQTPFQIGADAGGTCEQAFAHHDVMDLDADENRGWRTAIGETVHETTGADAERLADAL
jgi:hypothetical protein